MGDFKQYLIPAIVVVTITKRITKTMANSEQFIGEQLIVSQNVDSTCPQVESSKIMLDVHPDRAELYEELHNMR